MEGDYYDYEKNLSRSFDSSEPRKRQRLANTPIMPASSAKGRSTFHNNYYSDEVEDVHPTPTYPPPPPYHHPQHQYHSPERATCGYPYYPVQPLPQYGENIALHSHSSNNDNNNSPAAEVTNGYARQHYPYENKQHASGPYAPSEWETYNICHPYPPFHHTTTQPPWTNYSSPRYHHSNGESPNHQEWRPQLFHPSAKEDQPPEFFPHPAAPPYPYYFPGYPLQYTQHQHEPECSNRSSSHRFYAGPDGMPTTYMEEMPVQRIMPLFMACDEERLSEYQCLARKQIEVFSATYTELKMTVQGRNRQIFPGQVGIRCRFCAHIPVKQQARASVYYPSKLDCIYQAAQNMASVHLAKHCRFVPEDIRNELLRHMKDRKSSAGGGKEYWAVSARSLGIEECDGRLRFASAVHDDSARTVQIQQG